VHDRNRPTGQPGTYQAFITDKDNRNSGVKRRTSPGHHHRGTRVSPHGVDGDRQDRHCRWQGSAFDLDRIDRNVHQLHAAVRTARLTKAMAKLEFTAGLAKLDCGSELKRVMGPAHVTPTTGRTLFGYGHEKPPKRSQELAKGRKGICGRGAGAAIGCEQSSDPGIARSFIGTLDSGGQRERSRFGGDVGEVKKAIVVPTNIEVGLPEADVSGYAGTMFGRDIDEVHRRVEQEGNRVAAPLTRANGLRPQRAAHCDGLRLTNHVKTTGQT
jgi:hypothetical protein